MASKNKNILQNICRPETILAIHHEWKVTLPVRNKCHEKYLVQNIHLNYWNFNPHPLFFCIQKIPNTITNILFIQIQQLNEFWVSVITKNIFQKPLHRHGRLITSTNAMLLTTPYWIEKWENQNSSIKDWPFFSSYLADPRSILSHYKEAVSLSWCL